MDRKTGTNSGQSIPAIPSKFLKPFDHNATEDRIYERWVSSRYFNPDHLPEKAGRFTEPFSIVLPPPNVTGILHMGSALMLAVEDIMVRYARMRGKKTLWIPGTDHAAIATQSKVEKEIQKSEGKTRHDLGREELLKRIDTFASDSRNTIVSQVKKMGCSIDWSREAFTLDEKRSLAVRTAFKKMYEDGLIYRGYRVVNWDPKGQTTISDDEIVYEPRKAVLYTFRYSKEIPISISTTRPETKLGDTAIAVHPDDVRYRAFVGKTFNAVFAGEKISIKVVADETVDPVFGTGALGVTPAHSHADADIANRHKLEMKQVINEYGKMTVGMEGVVGKKSTDARTAVVEWLRSEGLMEKEEDIEQNISVAERTGGVIEPLPKLQWFVAVDKMFTHAPSGKKTTLKQLMREAVTSNSIEILPDNFKKIYFHWIDNLRDWCISRQIWYGHRIPVWYKGEEIYCGVEAPDGEWKQDEDTLDTWFSSGLWTFSTLGWPNEKEFAEHRMYHPTSILETGTDILFFWVARMILMSTYILGEVPFKTVYLHGIVRDGKGRKISKSLGNNIDPVDMIEKYGADAVRMSLVVGVGPGNDSKVSEEKIKGYRNFSNKIWNVTRFVLSSIQDVKYDPTFSSYTEDDLMLKRELDGLVDEITKEMDEYRLYLVAEKLYHYVWHRFADVILEESKKIFTPPTANTADCDIGDKTKINSRIQFLMYALDTVLRTLHPFTPFITEEIWAELPWHMDAQKEDSSMLIVGEWPGK
jgi:valyl-tRNA synthetase